MTNRINDKKYVGQTRQDLKYYLCSQKTKALHSNGKPKLYAAIRKYGIENFSIESLIDCDSQEDLNFVEMLFIAAMKTQTVGYNLADGGGGRSGMVPWNKGKCCPSLVTSMRGNTNGRHNKGRSITWGAKIRATMKARRISPSLSAQKLGGKARHAAAGGR
jgi:hypothetical protein